MFMNFIDSFSLEPSNSEHFNINLALVISVSHISSVLQRGETTI